MIFSARRRTALVTLLSPFAICLAGASAHAGTDRPDPAGTADREDRLIIPLYAPGAIAPLGVPEIREERREANGLLIRNVSEPTLELFRPARGHQNGTAVIVAPGGGFVGLDYDNEGTRVARAMADRGVTAFLLKYRTILSDKELTKLPPAHQREMDLLMTRAKSGAPIEVPRFAGEPHAIEDGVRALALVRQRASEWGIDIQRIGVLGFSAGGYLAADLAIGDSASRPAFVGLIYAGLRTPVPSDASPAFIAAAADDEFQPNDALLLYDAWHRAGAPAELHLYEHGGHGFGLTRKGTASDHWVEEFVWWMQARGLMARPR